MPPARSGYNAGSTRLRRPDQHLLKNTISGYTETEFLELLKSIFRENRAPTDVLLDVLLNHYRQVVEHPSGTDLIYYPETGDCTPESLLYELKSWLAINNKPGFKI